MAHPVNEDHVQSRSDKSLMIRIHSTQEGRGTAIASNHLLRLTSLNASRQGSIGKLKYKVQNCE